MKPFSRQLESGKEPATVLAETLDNLSRPLHDNDYDLVAQGMDGVTYVRRYRPWVLWVLVVLTFPFGLLLLLLPPREAVVSLSFAPRGDHTLITLAGVGPSNVRDAFARMEA